jgi:peptidoglycan/xylan/chitin deacetylase (PgdA/CDA1 family)
MVLRMPEFDYTRLHGIIVGAILATALLVSASAHATVAEDKSAAVIFVYQRVGEDSVPQGNISVDQFKEHIEELKKDGYAVLPLPKIIAAVKDGKPLPPKTVGITFEGAYQTTLSNAVPLLEEAQLPYTIFFAPDMLDNDSPGRMTWKQLLKLRKDGLVTFGLLPAAYEHMVNQTTEQNAALINRAMGRYREMLEEEPQFFAYPYGEFNAALKKQLASYKFTAVFGQQSGIVHSASDFMALPRFTMTDDFGDLDRFTLTANALPLPVSDVVPEDAIVTDNPPTIGFTVTPDIHNLGKLSCFASSLGKLPLMLVGKNRVEIRPPQPFTDRRTRINCTLPNEAITPGEPLNWRWFGMLLISPSVEEDSTADTSEEGSEDQENQ